MPTTAPTHAESLPDGAGAPSPLARLLRAWDSFWFTPSDGLGLHVVRACTGILLLSWLLGFLGHQGALFGMDGWVDRQAYRELLGLPEGPPAPIGWSPIFLASSPWFAHLLYGGSMLVLVLFTLGIATRLTSVLTWLVVIAFTSNPALSYGGDVLLLILSFYLMVGYLLYGLHSQPRSARNLLLGSRDAEFFARWRSSDEGRTKSTAATIALRLLQIHIAIVIFVSGLHKLQISVWWAGLALWFPLFPPFETTLEEVLAIKESGQPLLLMFAINIATYAVLAWQICFPFMAWKNGARPLVLGGAFLGWLGCSLLFGLPLFGPALLIGCLSFVPGTTWRRWLSRTPMPSETPAVPQREPLASASARG
ncbi:hypothetical protein Pan216_22430 [Planctomycetes bacterium Pan216]|uniref:HTTM-like domain-containing protein n=1 Tax=Kolteria novifilia TaxID=2527975 RepID=A0A518B336_9BACT|nr:hypothetical protein Pan216_22430 [Planctomycetes bacterium Pan216]